MSSQFGLTTTFRAGAEKLAWLHRAHLLLVVSFVAVLLLITSLAFLPSAPEAGPTRILIVTPSPSP